MAGKPGGRMLAVQEFVADNPGCSKTAAAHGIGQMNHNYGQGFGPVERAIRRGMVICDWARPNRARLFASAKDMREYYGFSTDDEYWRGRPHP